MDSILNEVILYRIISVEQIDHLVGTEYSRHSVWTLTKPEGLQTISSKAECTRHKQKYVMQYKICDLSLKKLLHIVHSRLTVPEAQELFNKSPWLWDIYRHWLKGGKGK